MSKEITVFINNEPIHIEFDSLDPKDTQLELMMYLTAEGFNCAGAHIIILDDADQTIFIPVSSVILCDDDHYFLPNEPESVEETDLDDQFQGFLNSSYPEKEVKQSLAQQFDIFFE